MEMKAPPVFRTSGVSSSCAGDPRIIPQWSHTTDFKIGAPVPALPVAWPGWPSVCILWMGQKV